MVVINPIVTGRKFFLASSNGDTLQTAATGINAQGIKVPPPIQIVQIWPKAANGDEFSARDEENNLVDEPTRERPENPEPSNPVSIPTPETVNAAMILFKGTALERAIPKSFIIPSEVLVNGLPIICSNPLPPK